MTHDAVTDAMRRAGAFVGAAYGHPNLYHPDGEMLAEIYLAMKEASKPAVDDATIDAELEAILAKSDDEIMDEMLHAAQKEADRRAAIARPVAVEGDDLVEAFTNIARSLRASREELAQLADKQADQRGDYLYRGQPDAAVLTAISALDKALASLGGQP